MNDHELLTQIDGIGAKRADNLLAHFADGRAVAKRACSGWGEIMKVDGFDEDAARELFYKMKEADVFHQLRGY